MVRDGVTMDGDAGAAAANVAQAIGAYTPANNGEPHHSFLVTDAEERFRRIASDFLEQEIADLELVAL